MPTTGMSCDSRTKPHTFCGRQILQQFRVEYSGRPLRLKMQLNCTPDAAVQFTLVERRAATSVRRRERAAAAA